MVKATLVWLPYAGSDFSGTGATTTTLHRYPDGTTPTNSNWFENHDFILFSNKIEPTFYWYHKCNVIHETCAIQVPAFTAKPIGSIAWSVFTHELQPATYRKSNYFSKYLHSIWLIMETMLLYGRNSLETILQSNQICRKCMESNATRKWTLMITGV